MSEGTKKTKMSMIWKCRTLTHLQKLLLVRMFFVAKIDEEKLYDIYITQERLADELSVSIRTIKNVIKQLTNRGVLQNTKSSAYEKNNFKVMFTTLDALVDKVVDKPCITKNGGAKYACEGVQNTTKQGAQYAPKQDNNICSIEILLLGHNKILKKEEEKELQSEQRGSGEAYNSGDDPVLNPEVYPTEIESRVAQMASKGEFHANIVTSVDELTKEVMYHVQHRNRKKTETPRHAYHAALKMIVDGTWSTPFGYRRAVQRRSSALGRELLQRTMAMLKQAAG